MREDPIMFKNKYRIPSARRPGWDYRLAGWYFVTICTKDRVHYFGEIVGGKISLSPIGKIVRHEWYRTAQIRPNVGLDAFVVMPNHIHGIIAIENNGVTVETLRRNVSTNPTPSTAASPDQRKRMSEISPRPNSLSAIIRSFKSITARTTHDAGFSEFHWQPRYHDHVIRNAEELERIQWYIRTNPYRWERDRNNRWR